MPIRAEVAETLLANLDQPVFVTDEEGTIQSVNPAFETYTGFSSYEAMGRTAPSLETDESPSPPWTSRLQNLKPGESWNGVVIHKYPDREDQRVRQTITPLEDEEGALVGYVVLNLHLDRLEEEGRRMEEGQPLRDDLTDLPNTPLLHDRVGQALQPLERNPDRGFALLYVDLDGFESITEQHGRPVADRVIQTVAQRLNQNIRPGDTAARSAASWLGVDEFVILLEEIQQPSATESIVKRLLVVIREPMKIQDHAFQLDATVGIVFSTPQYEEALDMLQDAETAMYRAREEGDDYAFFTGSMEEDLYQQFQLESDLRESLQEKAFELHYQPVFDLEANEPEGFEALLRWSHPEKGLLRPREFLLAAERSGLIVPLGRWVLREALAQLESWREADRVEETCFVSVNLSPAELADGDFLDGIDERLEASSLQPDQLHLEFIEPSSPEDSEQLDHRIPELSERGIRLGLDDFGSGHSAVEQLSRWAIDYLKIDRTFLDGIDEDGEQSDLMQSILEFAEANDLHVIVEGVETEEEHELLRAWECPAAQGYFYAEPMGPDDVEKHLDGTAPKENDRGRWGTV